MRTDVAVAATIAIGLGASLSLTVIRHWMRWHQRARRSVMDRLVAEGMTPVECFGTLMIDLYFRADPFPRRRGLVYRVVAGDAKGRVRRGAAMVETTPYPNRNMLPPELTGRIDLVWEGDVPPLEPTFTRPTHSARRLWDADLDGPAPVNPDRR